MFSAGLLAGTHCALMCGVLHAAALRHGPTRRTLPALQLGRVSAYALIGAAAGGAGAVLMRLAPSLPWLDSGRTGLSLLLLGLGAGLLWRRRAGRGCCRPAAPARPQSGAAAYLRGLAFGVLPCGLLYAAAGYAALSASAWQGAALMTAFGLGTTPGAALASASLLRLHPQRGTVTLRCATILAWTLAAGLLSFELVFPASFARWCFGTG